MENPHNFFSSNIWAGWNRSQSAFAATSHSTHYPEAAWPVDIYGVPAQMRHSVAAIVADTTSNLRDTEFRHTMKTFDRTCRERIGRRMEVVSKSSRLSDSGTSLATRCFMK
jgi:hypothetical protein